MTTLTNLHADPIALALLAALDAGDDSALLPLADRMEENGDERAAGLRVRLYRLRHDSTTWWHYFSDVMLRESDEIHTNVYTSLFRRIDVRAGDKIVDRRYGKRKSQSGIQYPTRSAAYLALAEALIA